MMRVKQNDGEYQAQLSRVDHVYQEIKDALGEQFDVEDISTLVYLWWGKKVILEKGRFDAATSGKIRMLKDAIVVTLDEDISYSDALMTYLHEIAHVFLEDLEEIDIEYEVYRLDPDSYESLNRDKEDKVNDYLAVVREGAREALGTLLFMHLHETSMSPPKEARLMHREM